ncbi:MAG: carbamoyl-phosphate synthase large subunit [Chloroherpetonaceae bacterium]|nr:carbamoyl-phosphate synthase large subunit [Chloroherpetonaceae bacterium]MDW8438579.1 carbamoyl-phosphate synthase large subunit [Chloroherpetonaceae bacterium]
MTESTTALQRLSKKLPKEKLLQAKQFGFSDVQLARIFGVSEGEIRALRKQWGVLPVYKTVDTCAAEFEAETPYHYSTYAEENESKPSKKKKVVILGGGPNRIGQGIEFDYCCVQAVYAFRDAGYETIMINCNPETVSTDYDVADKLYFEPLTFEDVMNVLELEKPEGVVVSFGGQTPLRLSTSLEAAGIRIFGTSSEGIDVAEDRKKFGALLDKLGIPHPDYGTATSLEEAMTVAKRIGYPILVRPSYVLGGRAMQIIYNDESLENYVRQALNVSDQYPLLIDRFLEHAKEFDVDALSDGKDCVVAGIMEHIEAAGIHSGDSTSILPPLNVPPSVVKTMKKYARRLAKALKVVGLMNVQFAAQGKNVYVLEVNPRASRTVPFVTKATGMPLVKVACRLMLGEKLSKLKKTFALKDCDDLKLKRIAIKEPVFPFAKFLKAGVYLGPEMRSTGEVMSFAETFGEAFAKSALAAGSKLPTSGTVFVSVNDSDKNERALAIARRFYEMGFDLIGTSGTAKFLRENGLECKTVFKVGEGRPNIFDVIMMGKAQFVINTPLGEKSRFDEQAIGAASVLAGVPWATTIEGAEAAVAGIEQLRKADFDVKSLQEYLNHKPKKKSGR